MSAPSSKPAPDRDELAKKVFVRRASGLIRGLSWQDLFANNMNGLAPTAMVAALYIVVPALYPGSDIVTAYLLILPIALCYAISYGILGACMPRSGGDYVFGSRIIHPVWGLMGSMMYFVGQIVLLGTLPIFAFTYLLPTPLEVAFPGNPMVLGFANWISAPLNQVVLGTLVIAAGTLIPILGLRIWKVWNWFMFFLGMAGAIAFLAVVGFSNHDAFVQGFNNYAAQYGTSYQGIFKLATSNGWVLTAFAIGPTLIAMQYTTLYVTTAWPVYIGGEAKEGRKSLPLAIISSIIVAWLIAILSQVLFYRVVPYDFSNALGYLAYQTPSAYPLPHAPEMYVLGNMIYANPITTLLVGFSIFIWTLSWLFNMNVWNSRMIFAWSFDRIFPKSLAQVHPRFHTPARALIVVGICGVLFLILAAYTSILTFMINSALLVNLAFIPAGFACALLPFKRKDIWEKGPSWTRFKLGPLPLATLVGLVQGIGLTILAVSLFFNPAATGAPINAYTVAGIAVIYGVLCFGLYYGMRWYHLKKEGIDVAWAFQELPPE
jgi:amino acid transporter